VAFRGVGLRRLEGRRLVPVMDREGRAIEGLPGEDVVALAERRDGSLWMGTFRNGLYRLPHAGAPLLHYQASDGIPSGPHHRGLRWIDLYGDDRA
jgi:hypothetical protein